MTNKKNSQKFKSDKKRQGNVFAYFTLKGIVTQREVSVNVRKSTVTVYMEIRVKHEKVQRRKRLASSASLVEKC